MTRLADLNTSQAEVVAVEVEDGVADAGEAEVEAVVVEEDIGTQRTTT